MGSTCTKVRRRRRVGVLLDDLGERLARVFRLAGQAICASQLEQHRFLRQAGVGPLGARCNYLTYENATSIAAKGQYVRTNALGGTIIWTIA